VHQVASNGKRHHDDLPCVSDAVKSIAQIAVHVGCVRAMQLDVNSTWPLFIVYGTPGGGRPRMLFPNVNQNPHVFTNAGKKDFFAIYLRKPGMSHPHEPS
jgi:hypothetical protein